MLRCAITDGSLALGQARLQPEADQPEAAQPESAPDLLDLRARLLAHAASVAARRIDFFLLREPTLPAGQLASLSRDLLGIFAGTTTRLLVHSRPDLAIATRAHGVHLPSSLGQLTPDQIRTLYASAALPAPIVSLSCHTEEDLLHAHTLSPDLILFGPIFGKQVQDITVRPGIGLEALRAACTIAAPIPLFALGGITPANTAACLEAGAAGIAGIRLYHP